MAYGPWFLCCSTTPDQQREVYTHPSHEVHSSSSVQQKRGHVDVAIVSSDVEGGEPTLMGEGGEAKYYNKNKTERHTFIIYIDLYAIPHPIIHTLP